ncbi:MAG: MscL family protein, partial [Candidatus Thorarchaeota archaeon]
VAFILGIYIGNVVQALVSSLIMPLIKIVYPAIEPEGVIYTLSGGPIMDSLITFVIVAFVVFIIVKIAARMGID